MDIFLYKDNFSIFLFFLFGISALFLGSTYFLVMVIIQNIDDIFFQSSQAPETTVKGMVFSGRREIY